METFELKTPIDEKRITKSDNIEPTTRPDISRDVYLPVFVSLVLLWLFAFGGLLIISGYRELAPSMLFGLPILIAAGLSTIVLIGRLKYYDDASFKRTIIELQPVEENGAQFTGQRVNRNHVQWQRQEYPVTLEHIRLMAEAWIMDGGIYAGPKRITREALRDEANIRTANANYNFILAYMREVEWLDINNCITNEFIRRLSYPPTPRGQDGN